MKKTSTLLTLCCALISTMMFAQLTPEVLYYKFDGTGTSVPNLASNPPAGTTTATIMGGQSQSGNGICGGSLVGTGASSTGDYVNTGWAPNMTGSWTISFRTSNVPSTTSTYYILGEYNTGFLRVFTGGVAGAGNWILRGPLTDVYANGGASTTASMTTFVYDASANNIYAYVNAVLVSTVAQPAITLSGPGPFKVGGYSSSASLPPGSLMDEFRFYSRALTPAEITQLYNPFTPSGFLGTDQTMCPGTPTTLALNWPASSVLWSDGSTDLNSFTTSTAGTVTVAVSGACGSGNDTLIFSSLTSTNSFSASACSMYTAPSGNMIMSSGTYMDTIPNTVGCDSVLTINVTIKQPTTSTISPSACSMYTAPSGTMYMSSGTYTDIIPNAVGCDSTITINLTINQPTTSTQNITSCDMYTAPSGATYMTSATIMDTIPNMAGCDSVMTITLTITNSTTSTITTSNCDSYTAPSGTVHTTSGTFTDIIPNMAGCDSTITINLTIMIATSSSQTVSSCGSFTSPSGNILSASGTYMDTIPNMAGCDSVITTMLTVNTVNANASVNNAVLTAAASGATYQWVNCPAMTPIAGATSQSYTATANGNYAVIVTQNSCTDTSTCLTVTGIGIAEHNFNNSVSLYPNPNEGIFNIDLGSVYSEVDVVITDVTGRVVFTQHVNSAKLIPVELNAAQGMYTIQLTSNDQHTVLHFVKN